MFLCCCCCCCCYFCFFVITETQCPRGWSIFDKSCYHVHHIMQKNWTEARKACLSSNSDLASIKSQYEDSFVSAYLNENNVSQPTWIGLKQDVNNKTIWSDGSNLTYVNPSLTPSSGPLPYCSWFTGYPGQMKWFRASCSFALNYTVCKRKGS